MMRTLLYVCMLVAGITLGITLGYGSTRISLTTLPNPDKDSEVSIPTMLAQDGTVQYIDTHGQTITLRTTAPYDQKTDISMRITYDSATKFWDQFNQPTSVTDIVAGARVRISIERKPGVFYAARIVAL